MDKVDHVKLLKGRLTGIRREINKALASAKIAHERAQEFYVAGMFHGGKVRNLDDLVMYLEDARKEIKEYLK